MAVVEVSIAFCCGQAAQLTQRPLNIGVFKYVTFPGIAEGNIENEAVYYDCEVRVPTEIVLLING
jgi:hypothetical protein